MACTRRLLHLILLSGVAIREIRAFNSRLLVPGRRVNVPSCYYNGPTHTKRKGPWSSRKNSSIDYREHKALSVPFSGPPADSRNQSWEDIRWNPSIAAENDHNDINALDKSVMAGTLLAGILSVYALFSLTAPGSWRFFAAGGICAATSHAIPTPIDVVKVSHRKVDDHQSCNVVAIGRFSKFY